MSVDPPLSELSELDDEDDEDEVDSDGEPEVRQEDVLPRSWDKNKLLFIEWSV